MLLTSCLIPQDDQVRPELPVKKNSPPKIVGESPQLRSTFYRAVGCRSNPNFRVTVEDEDANDTLRSLWFVDFTTPDTSRYFLADAVSAESDGGRRTAKPREIVAPASVTSYLLGTTFGTHLLTVFVADSQFAGLDTGTIGLEPLGNDRGYQDSYTWVLSVEPVCPP